VQGQLRRLCPALRLIGSGQERSEPHVRAVLSLALDYGINGPPGTGSPVAAFAMVGVSRVTVS